MKEYKPSRRKLIFRDIPRFLAAVGLGLAASKMTGCDDDESQPAPQRLDAVLENYPSFLLNENNNFDYRIVVGPDAGDHLAGTDIAVGLQNLLGEIVTVEAADAIDSLDYNLILVGRSSDYTFPGNENPWMDLIALPQIQMNPEEGYIKTEQYGSWNHVIVTGYDANSIRNCGKVLNDPHTFQLKGKEIWVEGPLNNFAIDFVEE